MILCIFNLKKSRLAFWNKFSVMFHSDESFGWVPTRDFESILISVQFIYSGIFVIIQCKCREGKCRFRYKLITIFLEICPSYVYTQASSNFGKVGWVKNCGKELCNHREESRARRACLSASKHTSHLRKFKMVIYHSDAHVFILLLEDQSVIMYSSECFHKFMLCLSKV